ncbi:hypothetical protein FSP39_007793 [Pinctada imbricata]|uniref:Uncharacterized protein n=1 Tax=Pinctada imbricata TaxID=66713 RepID=A0AA88YM06_PINIB|nr:hypothetical protein FSP39_007793 [Pinctada imbricata]
MMQRDREGTGEPYWSRTSGRPGPVTAYCILEGLRILRLLLVLIVGNSMFVDGYELLRTANPPQHTELVFRLLLLVVVVTCTSAVRSNLLPPTQEEECTQCKEQIQCDVNDGTCEEMRSNECRYVCDKCAECRRRKGCKDGEPCEDCEGECEEGKRKRSTNTWKTCKQCTHKKMKECKKSRNRYCRIKARLQCVSERQCRLRRWNENFGDKACRGVSKWCEGNAGRRCRRLRRKCEKRQSHACLRRCRKTRGKTRSKCLRKCSRRLGRSIMDE